MTVRVAICLLCVSLVNADDASSLLQSSVKEHKKACLEDTRNLASVSCLLDAYIEMLSTVKSGSQSALVALGSPPPQTDGVATVQTKATFAQTQHDILANALDTTVCKDASHLSLVTLKLKREMAAVLYGPNSPTVAGNNGETLEQVNEQIDAITTPMNEDLHDNIEEVRVIDANLDVIKSQVTRFHDVCTAILAYLVHPTAGDNKGHPKEQYEIDLDKMHDELQDMFEQYDGHLMDDPVGSLKLHNKGYDGTKTYWNATFTKFREALEEVDDIDQEELKLVLEKAELVPAKIVEEPVEFQKTVDGFIMNNLDFIPPSHVIDSW